MPNQSFNTDWRDKAAPAIQTLGGERRSAIALFATAVHRLRLAVLFGHVLGTLPLR